MRAPSEARPGSDEFRRALLDRLSAEGSLLDSGPLELLSEEQVSRNTVIFRCRMGDRRLVAKAQLTKPAAVVVAEFHMLKDMARALRVPNVRALRPVAVLEELGVLVTEEEEGDSLRAVLERALVEEGRVAWSCATHALEAAARALRAFHDAYETAVVSAKQDDGTVRLYMDFSAKNILVQQGLDRPEDMDLILMDPPEEEKWGPRSEDIGAFCFDVARIRFLPRFVLRRGIFRKLDLLKATFIRAYFGGERQNTDDLNRIREGESGRAMLVLNRYMRPWRYRSVVKEIVRSAYLGPLTTTYLLIGIRGSHRRVARYLREGRVGGSALPSQRGATD